MPYETYARLTTPPDDAVIWRYMDFAKFVQLLDCKSLWFPRADQFEDPLEGTYTDAELEELESLVLSVPLPHGMTTALEAFQATTRMMRATAFINCWRLSPHESLAMWDLYGKGNGIVAIKSTVGRLKREFDSISEPVYVAQVKYVDWATTKWDNNTLAQCARKEISYAHETEMRAIIWSESAKIEWEALERAGGGPWNYRIGMSVPVEPERLVTEIMVGPREANWITPLIQSVLKKYAMHTPVIFSDRLKQRTK